MTHLRYGFLFALLAACGADPAGDPVTAEVWANRSTLAFAADMPGTVTVRDAAGAVVRRAPVAAGAALFVPGLTPRTPFTLTLDTGGFARTYGALTGEAPPQGYTDRSSARPGETLPLFLSSPLTTVTVELVPALDPARTLARWQFGDVPDAFFPRTCPSNGCDWPRIASVTLPVVKSGYYLLRFSNEAGVSAYPLVVKPAAPGAHRLAVVASTNTWQAYNPWGGASYYHNDLRGPALRWVSFRRPYAPSILTETHLGGGELHLARWLEAQGIAYDLYADEDLDAGALGDAYDTWIFHVHSEYWSKAMLARYDAHVRAGGRAVFLSGDVMAWEVAYTADGRLYKAREHPNRDGARYAGATYTGGDYGTYAGYAVLAPSHWAFEGTGLGLHDTFGEAGAYGGASGHETDKIPAGARGRTRLAKGANPGGGADMFTYALGEGEVFHVGSVTFTGALEADARVSKIVRNVIRRYNGQ